MAYIQFDLLADLGQKWERTNIRIASGIFLEREREKKKKLKELSSSRNGSATSRGPASEGARVWVSSLLPPESGPFYLLPLSPHSTPVPPLRLCSRSFLMGAPSSSPASESHPHRSSASSPKNLARLGPISSDDRTPHGVLPRGTPVLGKRFENKARFQVEEFHPIAR